jgi:hypothetical protein
MKVSQSGCKLRVNYQSMSSQIEFNQILNTTVVFEWN